MKINIPPEFSIGKRLKGKVVLRRPFGVFVEVQDGVIGLVKLPNAGRGKNTPDSLPLVGTVIDCEVIQVEMVKEGLKLNLRNCSSDSL